MNYYERHIGDYLKDTVHLSLLEHGIYGRLLDIYYTRESALPADQVMRLVGARTDEERSAVRDVLNEFFSEEDGFFKHSRCEREIARYQEKQRKASASASARWNKSAEHTERNANAMRTHSEGNALQTPDTRHQTPKEIHGSVSTELPASDKPTPPLKAKDLIAEGVDPQAAADWLALRKAKRLPLTATAWDDTKSEGQKLGLTPAQAVAHAVTHNWAGFRASWLDQNKPGQATPRRDIFAGAI